MRGARRQGLEGLYRGVRRLGLVWTASLLLVAAAALGAQPADPPPAATQAGAPRTAGPRLWAPAAAGQGEPLLVWLECDLPAEGAGLRLEGPGGRTLSQAQAFFFPSAEEGFLYCFLLAVPLRAKPGQAKLSASFRLAGAEGLGPEIRLERSFSIEQRSFAHEDIPLDKANTALRTAPDPARDAESEAFAKLFQVRDETALFASGPMTRPLPLPWRQTAGFADERRYLYSDGTKDSSLHGGLDLGAKEGTPVSACAAGRVIFAARRILTGNTVVIEHLPGLFSLYMHLSALEVGEGEVVDAGQRIGLVGSTGLSTGPHLHWELRLGSVSVDPRYWLTRPLLDKDAITGRIKLPTEGR